MDTLFAQLRPAAAPGGGGAASTSAPDAMTDAPAIIDVRTRGEFAGGRVPGALNVPLDELSDAVRAGRLDNFRARPLAVVCQIGMRSAQARPGPQEPALAGRVAMLYILLGDFLRAVRCFARCGAARPLVIAV